MVKSDSSAGGKETSAAAAKAENELASGAGGDACWSELSVAVTASSEDGGGLVAAAGRRWHRERRRWPTFYEILPCCLSFEGKELGQNCEGKTPTSERVVVV